MKVVTYRKVLHKRDVWSLDNNTPGSVKRCRKADCNAIDGQSRRKRAQKTGQIIDSILHENRIHFDNILYTSNIQAIMGLFSSGYGVSFVFDSHLRHRIDDNPIDCYSFGNPCTRYDFVAATRKRSYLPRYVEDFIEIVRQAV